MSNTVLITGSSGNLGRATAKFFQRNGWNVVATMRSPDQEQELSALDNVLVTRLDVQDTASISAAVEAGIARFGGIDVLVNNAGYGEYGLLEATPEDKIRSQFEVNVIGLLATTKAVIPHFRARGDGVIINISSIGGKVTFPLGTLYHGSKFAVEGLSEALSYEMAPIGVKVKLVEPGMIKAAPGGGSMSVNDDQSLTEYREFVGKIFAALGPLMDTGSAPELVSEVIFRAATDGTDTLRYIAGPDAEELLAARKAADDVTFLGGIKGQFGL
ncbi:SDR family oxidoreductase [Haliangium sp.]|uniref:SDR family oxidoreductase n=1 Tax=Haliangium sp. TaxID=2663208 RepID=UPI003D1273B8